MNRLTGRAYPSCLRDRRQLGDRRRGLEDPVERDDRQILGDAEAQLARSMERPEGEFVGRGEDRSGAIGEAEPVAHGARGALAIVT